MPAFPLRVIRKLLVGNASMKYTQYSCFFHEQKNANYNYCKLCCNKLNSYRRNYMIMNNNIALSSVEMLAKFNERSQCYLFNLERGFVYLK